MTIAQFPNAVKRRQIGDVIKSERELHEGHTQEYCARKIGYTRRQWINWEMNYSELSGDAMRKICSLYPNLKVKFFSPDFT